MTWSSRIFFTRPHRDARTRLIEMLYQDGFSAREITVPEIGTEDFTKLINDSEAFAKECGAGLPACPVRAGRWLNRISTILTKRSFNDLPHTARQALAHAAIVFGGRPELLR